MSTRFLNWCVTEKGRRAMANAAGVAAFGVFSAHVAPHALFLDQYKDFVQIYSGGVGKPVPAEVLRRAQTVLEEANTAKSYTFFSVFGLDAFHAGSTAFRNGAIIGIPQNFSYKKEEDVQHKSLLVNQKSFNFDSPTGESLIRSIILSERAQKFAIAKEIHAADSQYVNMHGGLAALSTLLVYLLSNVINTKMELLHKVPRPARITIYAINSLIGATFYFFLKDGLNNYFDKASDIAACNMGKDYALGGVEFYEKMLERNRALRDAMGKEGRGMYTIFGNEEVWIRTKRLPVTAHIDIVRDSLKEMESMATIS